MDHCFTALIDAFTPYGGDVFFFGGDAIFVAFTGSEHCRRAVDGAIAVHSALRRIVPISTPLGPVPITVSVGVASGSAELVVGDGPQRPLFLLGSTISATLAMESRSHAGQVLVAPTTARHLPPTSYRWLDDGAALIVRRRPGRPPAVMPAGPPLPVSDEPALHLPAALRDRLLDGDAPSEHRHIAVAFVVLRELDDLSQDQRVAIVQRASVVVGEACARFDVCWMHPDVIANGAKIILAAGVPVQHDDDELRVVAAAREIVTSDVAAHLAIGVHRGTAFVGEFGHPRRRTYSVNGDTTITAARLTAAAGTGEVMATADVVERLRGRYRTGPELAVKAKGRSEPMRAFEIGSMADRPDSAVRGSLIGRSTELAALDRILGAHAVGEGAVVEVIGASGIGKTRLLREVLAAHPPGWLSVRGELDLQTTPFGAVGVALRELLVIGSPTALVDRIGDLAPLLGPVLGFTLPTTPASSAIEQSSVQLRRTELLVDLATRGGGVLFVDDSQWLDASSVDLLRSLATPLATAGWIVLCARRPETEPVVPASTSVTLEALPDGDIKLIVEAASKDRPLSDAVLDAVVARAGGNPLFALQLIHGAATTADVGLPESAERAVGARIDLLPAASRRQLRRASVLGTRVDLRLLRRITGDPGVLLPEVWAGLTEFVRHDGDFLTFRHDLYRLAAYEGLTFAERTSLHHAAVQQLSRRRATPAAALAEHARHADRPYLVTHWASRAADEAEAAAAFVDAARLRDLAAESASLAALPHPRQAELHASAAGAHELLAEPEAAERHYRRALKLAPQRQRTRIRARLAEIALRADDLGQARRRVASALRHLRPDDPGADVLRVELTILRAAIRGAGGDLRGSDHDARAAVRLASRLRRPGLRGRGLMQLALNADLVDAPETERLVAAAVPLLERGGHRRDVAILRLNRGVTHMTHGRWMPALESLRAAADGFADSGEVFYAIATELNRAGIQMEQGHLDEARRRFEAVVRRARAAGVERGALLAKGSAARAQAWGREADALAELAGCITRLEVLGHQFEADDLEWCLVEALVLHGRFQEALERSRPLLERLMHRSGHASILTVRRAIAVARHLTGEPDALCELAAVLEDARAQGCGIEIARCAQALEALSPAVDPTWAAEREHWCAELGVVWMPPVTFTGEDTAQVVCGQ